MSRVTNLNNIILGVTSSLNRRDAHALQCMGVGAHVSALVVALLCVRSTIAQSRQVPAPPQEHPVAIVGAMIHPVSSAPIVDGYIVVDKGKITAVGAGAPASLPADAQTIDGAGLHVYPGLILPSTYLGLSEIGDIEQTNDHTELGRVKPEVRAAVAVNPDSDLIPVARANGILTAVVMPRGGLISGRASTMRLDGWTWESMTIDDAAGLVVNWPRTEGGGGFGRRFQQQQSDEEVRNAAAEDISEIDRVLDDAQAYIKAKDSDDSVTTDLRYEALRPILARETPVFVNAASTGQIEAAVAWTVRRNLDLVIVGGTQADRCAALLKKHDVPVIITGTHRMPQRRYEAYDAAFTLPARLHEAGVRFCLTTGGEAAHDRHLNHMAATAAAYGLPKDEALKMVTLSAAQIIGQGETLGSLEVGKSATLIVTTGDPMEIVNDTLVAFIDGRRIDLGSRHKALYAKYQQKYRQMGILPGEDARAGDDEAEALGTR
jgi:imidazolonepropionase-like amidohydrolase